MNNDLKNSIDFFINEIKNTYEYKNYLKIRESINKSNEIKELTDKIKSIEKKLVLTPSIDLEKELENNKQLLNDIPLYLDYKDSISEVSNMLVLIKNRFDIFIEDITL